ncbi:MAG TPA: hypothetical protein VG841_01820 [Caulobacterales bacterium]|nr:hypothetical protein [Caulobacterales bacterium]
MAQKKPSRLKVYVTRIGIKDWVVAAPNQKQALKAWDVRENLFASGAAKETNDPASITLAMKNPGVPVAAPGPANIKIPVGGNIVSLDARRKTAPKLPPPTPPKPKRDRTRLDAAELALRQHEREAKRRRADMERRRRLFEDELAAEDAELARTQKQLEAKLEKARRAYEQG